MRTPFGVQVDGAAVFEDAHKDMGVQIRRAEHVMALAHIALAHQRVELLRQVRRHRVLQMQPRLDEVVLRDDTTAAISISQIIMQQHHKELRSSTMVF